MNEKETASGLPPEFTAPAETLKPGPHDSDVYMESTGYTADDDEVSCWIGRNVAGATIGLIQLRAILPLIPGNMGNATTFDFPLLYREMLPPDPYKIMATTVQDIKKGKYIMDWVIFLKRGLPSSLSISAIPTAATVPTAIKSTLRTSVFLTMRQRTGAPKRSSKFLRPTHGLKNPVPALKSSKATTMPNIGI